MNLMALDLERFRVTATAIRNGSFDIQRDIVPLGYVNFCVLHAEDPDPNLQYPLPPTFRLVKTERAKKKNKPGRADTMTQRANTGQIRNNTCRLKPYLSNR